MIKTSHLHTGALLAENAGLILDSWHSPSSLDERAQRLGHVNGAELVVDNGATSIFGMR